MKKPIDVKRLAHLLYLSIPLSWVEGFENRRLSKPHYGDTTKAFEERLKGELNLDKDDK